MKKRKAAGCDNVSPEHVIYGGKYMVSLLTLLVNSMYSNERLPGSLKRGIIVPILKGKTIICYAKTTGGLLYCP